jgi:hypothetical protein
MMSALPLWTVKEQVNSRLITDTQFTHQALLSTNQTEGLPVGVNDEVQAHYTFGSLLPSFWVSAVPNGTTTGVMHEHALQLNSSVACERISLDDFPLPCPGSFPFTYEYVWNDTVLFNGTRLTPPSKGHRVRVCLPGSYIEPPWDRSRDAVTIHEELCIGAFIDEVDFDSGFFLGLEGHYPFAIRCTVNTTRGYFELGNVHNGLRPQPLLAKFPRGKEVRKYNDYDANPTYEELTYESDSYPPYLGPT